MSISPAKADHHGSDDNKFQIYIQIAMLLAVLTGVEIVGIFLPFPTWVIVTAVVVLSAVKFLYVIFFFMHLRWDKAFCTILFFIGLMLAGGTVWALLAIFGAKDSIPLTSISSATTVVANYLAV